MLLGLLVILGFSAAVLLAVKLIFALPSLDGRTVSSAVKDTPPSILASSIAAQAALNPSKSGIYPLMAGDAAFAARMLLAGTASRSIDAQYYMWRQDFTGRLLAAALVEAADRDVRVRLLLDDNTTSGHDAILATLDSHPNIEVRLFNPFVIRSPRLIGYLTNFFRLNRRMHNKSLTIDNHLTIVGGRNVGDEYFAAAKGMQFADLDVLAAGPVVADVSRQFDQYWASQSSYPVASLLPAAPEGALAAFMSTVDAERRSELGEAYAKLTSATEFGSGLWTDELKFEWSPVALVHDDPAKGLGQVRRDKLLLGSLAARIGQPKSHVDLVSPYFVPGRIGARYLCGLRRDGLKVRILTNSMQATDVQPVHAGYARYRKKLLKSGIELYELKSFVGKVKNRRHIFKLGSSNASLHAKTFAIDGERLFVGSFNFDLRSAFLNCEMGLLIDSPALARSMSAMFEHALAELSYRPLIDHDGRLYWLAHEQGNDIRHIVEPETTVFGRFRVWLISLLPIEWLL